MKKISLAKKVNSCNRDDELADRTRSLSGDQNADFGIVVGQLVALNRDSLPVVRFGAAKNLKPIACRSIVDIDERSLGREVVVQFEDGDVSRPIIMGILNDAGVAAQEPVADSGRTSKRFIEVDGDRLLLAGEREIVLQCGEARITLTKAGKILIHGNYVLTRSRGACKLKGATVEIN